MSRFFCAIPGGGSGWQRHCVLPPSVPCRAAIFEACRQTWSKKKVVAQRRRPAIIAIAGESPPKLGAIALLPFFLVQKGVPQLRARGRLGVRLGLLARPLFIERKNIQKNFQLAAARRLFVVVFFLRKKRDPVSAVCLPAEAWGHAPKKPGRPIRPNPHPTRPVVRFRSALAAFCANRLQFAPQLSGSFWPW